MALLPDRMTKRERMYLNTEREDDAPYEAGNMQTYAISLPRSSAIRLR